MARDIGSYIVKTWKGDVDIGRIVRDAPIPGDSTVLLGGSLIDGIGNPFSDIDVISISRERPPLSEFRAKNYLILQTGETTDIIRSSLMGAEAGETPDEGIVVAAVHDYADEWGTRFDIDYVIHSHIAGLIEKIAPHFQTLEASYGGAPAPFNFEERRHIDRIINGVALVGQDDLDALRASIPAKKYNYALYRETIINFSSFQDVLGAIIAGRWPMAIQLARYFLLETAKSWLHLRGVTNWSGKWVTVYLSRIEDDDRPLAERTVQLLQGQGLPEPAAYVTAILDTADAILARIVSVVDHDDIYVSGEKILQNIQSRYEATGRKDRHLNLSLEFYAKMGTAEALPLREFASQANGLEKPFFG